MSKSFLYTTLGIFSITFSVQAELSGNFSIQSRTFVNDPISINNQQHNTYLSVSAEPEYRYNWNEHRNSLLITPFVRIDEYDNQRSHVDVRELNYQQVFTDWELRIGVSKVFWGVTESQHLVDIINQTDNVENIDGEDKLGQPMVKISVERDWGNLDLFILPYFRERTFPDSKGRPGPFPYVDTDKAGYESTDEKNHIDYALRWFQYHGELELGLSYFTGTSREPVFKLGITDSQPVLVPYYSLMNQISLDAQYTTEEWLWKLEVIYRDWKVFNSTLNLIDETYTAATGGFEYTFVGIRETDTDLGFVMEYLYDERGELATTAFQNDIMMGLRLSLNDAESSEALLGVIYDIDTGENLFSIEASRRLYSNWKASMEIRIFNNTATDSPLYNLEQDDLIQLEIAYYY